MASWLQRRPDAEAIRPRIRFAYSSFAQSEIDTAALLIAIAEARMTAATMLLTDDGPEPAAFALAYGEWKAACALDAEVRNYREERCVGYAFVDGWGGCKCGTGECRHCEDDD